MDFPHKCVRCGYCCIADPCPIIRHMAPGIEQCHMLTFTGDIASCGLAGFIVPINDGCCIKARCFHGDEIYEFAALPMETKRGLAQKLLNERSEIK